MYSVTFKQDRLRFILRAVFTLLLAFGIRILDVTVRSLWFDEAIEYLSANVPFHMLPKAIVALNYQPPLQSYLLHGWLRVSIEPIWLRFLPITLSMLTVSGLMRWALRRFGTRGALLAGIVVTVMPTEVYYAQDVGEYALLVCTLTWALYFLDLTRKDACWRYWVLWGFFSSASVLSHYGAGIVVVPLAVLTLLENVWQGRKKSVVRQIVSGGICAALGGALLTYYLPVQVKRTSSLVAAPLVSVCKEFALLIQSVGQTFSYNLIGWPLSGVPKWVGIVALASIGLSAITVLRRLPRKPFCWLAAAYGVYFCLVRIGLYVGYGLRYGLIFTPLFVLATVTVIEGLWRFRSAFIAVTLLCLVVGIQAYALPNPTFSQWLRGEPSWQPREQMHKVFAYWQDHRRKDESTFVYYGAVPAFQYYLQVHGVDSVGRHPTPRPYECSVQRATEVCVENKLFFSPWIRGLSPEEMIQSMEEVLGSRPRRLWLIFSHVHGDEEKVMVQHLEGYYQVKRYHSAGHAAAYLLVQR